MAEDRPHVLTAARLWPPMMESLHGAFVVHERLHDTDPAAFERAAPRIRAIAASGESKVGRDLLARLPALELISVFGVGYDGIDVAAARERGVAVGTASALPVSIERIGVWTKTLGDRGILLVPLTTAMLKSKSS